MPDPNTPPAAPAPSWWARHGAWLVYSLLLLLAGVLGAVTGTRIKPPPPPVLVEVDRPVPVEVPVTVPVGQGWVSDPDAVADVVRGLETPYFADTPAGRASFGEDADIYLWDACRETTGDLLPARDQRQVGSCVSFGTASAVEHLLCVQIVQAKRASLPPPTAYRDLVQEVIYGGSRVEIGGGRIRGDGSVGAWAAKWVSQYGVIARGVHGSYDLTAYSEQRCREWGARGVPADLEALARLSPVKGTALVRSADEAVKALRQGYPIAVCSDQGFTMRRDADGFAQPSGTWAHCMAVVGYTAGPRQGFFVLNSWGPTAHTGPRGKGNPSPAGFWADAKVVDRMLKQGDSWAFSDAVGFPARKLDWFVARPEPRPVLPRVRDRLSSPTLALAW